MKRFLVLLVVLAGGVAWAAFSIPSNAATVNGTDISQQDLNSDVNAIANSAYYQCYLNSEEYLSSEGSEEAPPVLGAGTGQYAGDHPTATSAFVASYLETDIGHELALQLAAERHVSVTPAGLVTGRADLTGQITQVMSEILQTQQGQNVDYSCSLTGQAITGKEVLDSLPASFVDQQVQFVAEVTALEEDLAGVGSSPADLQNYFDAHGAKFDTACISAAVYPSESAAQACGSVGRLRDLVLDTGVEHRQQWRRGAGLPPPARMGVQSSLRCRPRQPGDRCRLVTDQHQQHVRAVADHLAHTDDVQQREERRGERRPGGRRDGDPEGARRR